MLFHFAYVSTGYKQVRDKFEALEKKRVQRPHKSKAPARHESTLQGSPGFDSIADVARPGHRVSRARHEMPQSKSLDCDCLDSV